MTGLYQRLAARGFPFYDLGGQAGQGALPDSTRPGTSEPGQPDGTWTDPNIDPGSVGAGLAAPEQFISGGLWGLSGAANPDRTPRTHAAPFADPTLPVGEYYAEADAAHGFDAGAADRRSRPPSNPSFRFRRTRTTGGANSNLQPLDGQIRVNAGYDGVQGYGGGGDGPRGTNQYMPLATDQQAFPGNVIVRFDDAGDVLRSDAEAGQFIPAAPEFGPWLGGGFDGPTAQVLAQQVTTGDVPAQGAPLPAQPSLPAYANSFWS
jgi:hypothetical protein